jgi:dTDP-4-dehydrorhamnose 3,5-epimerase
VAPKLIPEAISVHTHQEYGRGIEGVKVVRLTRFSDDGGSMTELARLDNAVPQAFGGFAVKQVNFSTLEPGVLKAFHVHERQFDVWFVPPSDRVLLVLVDVREGSATSKHVLKIMLGDGGSTLVKIPPGVAHGCKNVGPHTARLIYLTSEHFSADPKTTDEGRLPWDLVGPEIWEPAKD